MRSSLVLFCTAIVMAGCIQKSNTPESSTWKTYTSPDGNISFQYPSSFTSDLHDNEAERISFYLHNDDDSIQVLFSIYLMAAPSSAEASKIMDSPFSEDQRAATPRQDIVVGKCKALRQEYVTPGKPPHIKVVIRTPTALVSLTMGYFAERAELRPICERILNSVTIKNAQ